MIDASISRPNTEGFVFTLKQLGVIRKAVIPAYAPPELENTRPLHRVPHPFFLLTVCDIDVPRAWAGLDQLSLRSHGVYNLTSFRHNFYIVINAVFIARCSYLYTYYFMTFIT